VTHSSLIDGLCRDKKLDVALDIWNRVLNKGFSVDIIVHNILIHGLCSFGRTEKALHIYLEMKHKDCSPNLVTYNTLMDGLEVGNCEKAAGIWDEMLQAGLQLISFLIRLYLKVFALAIGRLRLWSNWMMLCGVE